VKRAGSGTARPSLDDLFQGWVSAFGWVEGVHDRCCLTRSIVGDLMDTDLDTLATALYARIDDTLKAHPELMPWRPRVGIAPKLSDAELLTLAAIQVLQGFNEEARWIRYAQDHLRHLFPYVPAQAGYNKRLRKSAGQLEALIRLLGEEHCRVGRLRVLRFALTLFLGSQIKSRVHPDRATGRVRVDKPETR